MIYTSGHPSTIGAPYRCAGCFEYTQACRKTTKVCQLKWAVWRAYPFPIVWPAPSMRTGNFDLVYAFRDAAAGLVKIGHSHRPYQRMREFQYYHGTVLEMRMMMRGGARGERRAHSLFHDHRRLGEWFVETPEITAWIEEHRVVRDHELSAAIAA